VTSNPTDIVPDCDILSYTFASESPPTTTVKRASSDQDGASNKTGGLSEGLIGQINRRLSKYNAQTGDIQISISWDDTNDIDLWVVFESVGVKSIIGWENPRGINNGFLDIDMNVFPVSNQPVENIVWPIGMAPNGRYTVYIQHYKKWDRKSVVPVYVRIQMGDEIIYRKSTATYGRGLQKVYTLIKKSEKHR
jgi:hypothetical protein